MLARYQATLHPEGIGGTKVNEKSRNQQIGGYFFVFLSKRSLRLAGFWQDKLVKASSEKKAAVVHLLSQIRESFTLECYETYSCLRWGATTSPIRGQCPNEACFGS
jgi:hypothetical protein